MTNMKWFTGSIPEAIQHSKTNNLLFIVYISGTDDDSTKMLSTWSNEEVCALCEQEKCVAIMIEADSDAGGFFSQIYPVVVVPSTFFISTNGIPIEVTGGYVEAKQFLKIIQSALQTHKSKTTTSPTAPSQPGNETAAASSVTETAAPPSPKAESSPKPESNSPSNSTAEGKDETSPEEKKQKLDFDSRVEIAKEKMEQKRLEKLLKEKEELKQKEKERRESSRNLQHLKGFQQEKEMKETQDQMRKEKEEERRARERVKADIARDRAERSAKFNKDKAARMLAQEEGKKAKLREQQKKAEQAESKRSEIARLQFRLTDGTSITQEFSSKDTLQTASTFISEHLNGEVSLSTIFPKRIFTAEDMMSTLAALNLAPSSVIIVIPKKQAVTQYSGGGSSGDLISMLLAPLMIIWNLVISFFTSSPSSSSSSSPASQAGGDEMRSNAYKRPSPSGMSRREGNLHRFTNRHDNDDDDESATWNGNSTQQL